MVRNKSLDEFEEVKVKVPKRLMRLIEHEHYFGRTREKLFTDCIRRGISCEVNDLPYDEAERLERKFKAKSELIVYPDKASL
jgi:hypothetical protein